MGNGQVGNGGNAKKTSNATLHSWIPNKLSIVELLGCLESDKIENNIRVAYQTTENDFNARSFEDAFVNRNLELLTSSKMDDDRTPPETVEIKGQFSFYKNKPDVNRELVPSDSKAKTDFAFDVMSFDEKKFGEWNVPAYIQEGLDWLAKNE